MDPALQFVDFARGRGQLLGRAFCGIVGVEYCVKLALEACRDLLAGSADALSLRACRTASMSLAAPNCCCVETSCSSRSVILAKKAKDARLACLSVSSESRSCVSVIASLDDKDALRRFSRPTRPRGSC